MTSQRNVDVQDLPIHYLVKGPVLSWQIICTHQRLPAGPRAEKRGVALFPAHTREVDLVTCPGCLTVMAGDVEAALTRQRCPHPIERYRLDEKSYAVCGECGARLVVDWQGRTDP